MDSALAVDEIFPARPLPKALVNFLGSAGSRAIESDIQDLSNIRPIRKTNISNRDFLRQALSQQRDFATPDPVTPDLFKEKTFRGISYQSPLLGTQHLGEWKPSEWLTPEIVDQMKKNGVIKTGLFLKKAPILATVKKMTIRHEVPQVEGFLNHVMSPILHDLFWTSLTGMDYGVSLSEKVFKAERLTFKYVQKGVTRTFNNDAIFYRKIKWNNPRTIKKIKIEPTTQDYNGYVQSGALGATLSGNIPSLGLGYGDIDIPVDKSFMWGKNQENSLWGCSDLDAVYEYWYWLELLSGYYMRYLEKLATPPLIGYAPPGTTYSKDYDSQVENLGWLADMLGRLQDGMAIVFPSQYDANSRNRLWEAKELNISTRGDLYSTAIGWLELAIFKGLFVPDKPVSQGTGATGNFGSYALADVQFEAFLVAEEWDLLSLVNAINKYVIRPLIDLNFGPKVADAIIQHPPLSRELKQRVYDIFLSLVANHPDYQAINFRDIADELGVAMYSEEELVEKRKENLKQVAAMTEATTPKQEPEDEEEPDEPAD